MPVEGIGAGWQPTGGRERRPPESSDEVRRLEAALNRISTAIVHRAERDAEMADRAVSNAGQAGPAVDEDTVDELKRRLDALIGRVRGLLGDAVA